MNKSILLVFLLTFFILPYVVLGETDFSKYGVPLGPVTINDDVAANSFPSNTIALVTFGLLIGVALLVKEAKLKKSIKNYVLVLLGGIVVFLFKPLSMTMLSGGPVDEGIIQMAIQMVSTFFGIYCVIWSIIRMVKHK